MPSASVVAGKVAAPPKLAQCLSAEKITGTLASARPAASVIRTEKGIAVGAPTGIEDGGVAQACRPTGGALGPVAKVKRTEGLGTSVTSGGPSKALPRAEADDPLPATSFGDVPMPRAS